MVLLVAFGLTYVLKQSSGSTVTFGNDKGFNYFSFYNLTQPTTIMVAGTDQEYTISKYGYAVKVKNTFKGRTDTVMVFKFDPTTKKISALNIPRDTKIYINGHRAEKINAINVISGPETLKKYLEDILEIKIDHYVLIDTGSIERIIDEAGGVEIDVPKKMVYKDKTDGLDIHLEPGRQTLSGKEVIGFLRFRHDSLGDIGRIQRQQLFIRAVKQKLSDPTLIAKFPQLTNIGLESILTDMKLPDLLKVANFARSIPQDSQMFATLPGDFSVPETVTKMVVSEEPISSGEENPLDSISEGEGATTERKVSYVTYQAPFVSYWEPNIPEIRKVVNRLFNNEEDIQEISNSHSLKIAVESSKKNKEIARKLVKVLQRQGYSIVDISDSSKHLQSMICAQKGNIAEARNLHHNLKLSSGVKVLAESYGSPLADITIVVGDNLAQQIEAFEAAKT
jgi:LCP family protein required for cell wall assembly